MIRYLKFAKKGAIHNNLLQKFLYLLGYSFAITAKQFSLTPNFLTLISCIFTSLAFIALVIKNFYGFIFFWLIAYILDYADGTLARMKRIKPKSILRIDHMSDLLKISFILLGIAIYYDNQIVWTLTFITSSSYLFYTILNHDLSNYKKFSSLLLNYSKTSKNINIQKKKREKKDIFYYLKLLINERPFLKKFILNFYSIFFVINGHTLIIFFFIPMHQNLAIILLTYFILINIYHSTIRVIQLSSFKRINK